MSSAQEAGLHRTGRLDLRPLAPSDLAWLYPIISDPCNCVHIPEGPKDSVQACRAWIERFSARWTAVGLGYWTVRLRDSGAVIGGAVQSAARDSGTSTTCWTGAIGDVVTAQNWHWPRNVRRAVLILHCPWSRGYTRRTRPRRPWHGISASGTSAFWSRITGTGSRCITGLIGNRTGSSTPASPQPNATAQRRDRTVAVAVSAATVRSRCSPGQRLRAAESSRPRRFAWFPIGNVL